jgi:hypothetical protein
MGSAKGFKEWSAGEEEFRRQPCMAASSFPGWEIEGLEEVAIVGRNYEGPWDNECSDEQVDRAFAIFWPSGGVPICPQTGLPVRLVESRFWEVVNRLWRACYLKKWASCFDNKLFEKFLKGQLIARKEADWTVSLMIRICGCLPIREEGWDQLLRCERFSSQHGRLSQPWGARVYKWIKCEVIEWTKTGYDELEVPRDIPPEV